MYDFNFQEILSLLDSYRELDPFYKNASWEKTIEWLLNDIQKLKEVINLKNETEVKEKLWNVVWSTLVVLSKFEDTNKINVNDIFLHSYKKIVKRKPFLIDWKEVTEDEARELWIKNQ